MDRIAEDLLSQALKEQKGKTEAEIKQKILAKIEEMIAVAQKESGDPELYFSERFAEYKIEVLQELKQFIEEME